MGRIDASCRLDVRNGSFFVTICEIGERKPKKKKKGIGITRWASDREKHTF